MASYTVTIVDGGVTLAGGESVHAAGTVDTAPASNPMAVEVSALLSEMPATRAGRAQYLANRFVDEYLRIRRPTPAPPVVVDVAGTLTITR